MARKIESASRIEDSKYLGRKLEKPLASRIQPFGKIGIMQRTFIISGEKVVINVKRMELGAKLLDVTAVGETWKRVSSTKEQSLRLHGITDDGTEIDGLFRILAEPEPGILEISPWTDHPAVGEGD